MPETEDNFGGLTATRDRRQHPRKTVSLNYLKLAGNGGIIVNISEGGLAFTAAEPVVEEFIPRLSFQLTFQLAYDARWIEASGRIIWLDDSRRRAGIQFVDIASDDRERIGRWISSQSSALEIQSPVTTVRKSWRKDITPFPSSRNVATEIETPCEIPPQFREMFPSENAFRYQPEERSAARAPQVETLPEPHEAENEAQIGEMFPSESGARHQAAEPIVPAAPRVERLAESHKAPSEEFSSESARQFQATAPSIAPPPRPIPETNEPRVTWSAAHPPRIPNFGYHAAPEDWADWVDPAATPHRSRLGFVVLGVLLVVIAFVIGTALGHGSLEALLDEVRSRIPDKIQPTQSSPAPAPSADAVAAAASPSPSSVNAPPPPKGADTSTRPPEMPPSPNSAASTGKNEETPVTENPADLAEASSSTESKSATPREDRAPPILVAVAGEGGRPFRLTTPATAVSASSSIAISSQTSILVPRQAGAEIAQQPKRLQPGVLIFHVEPQHPKGLRQNEVEIVKLRANVSENGQVTEVKQISGPKPLASGAISAIREWRYSPTLFDGRPVKTEEEITIAFRAR
jgi:protein TonB